MKKKVLVYDSQIGYYSLLKQTVRDGFEFEFYEGQPTPAGFDIVAFFMHDTIEGLDIARLYDNDMPFVLAAYNGYAGIMHKANVYAINTALPREEIVKMLKSIFKELHLPKK